MLWVNGEISETQAYYDSGFQFGRGAFETLLVREEPLFLAEHCARLNQALMQLGISRIVKPEAVEALLALHPAVNCVLKVIATEKNLVLLTRPFAYGPEVYERGFRLRISKMERNPRSHTVYLKTLNYLENVLEKEAATAAGFDESLLFNVNGRLAEGSMSNVFFVKAGKLYTPAREAGLLPGIVRGWVIEQFPVAQGLFSKADLAGAEEVFVTNSIAGVMPVAEIEGIFQPRSRDIVLQVMAAYAKRIGEGK